MKKIQVIEKEHEEMVNERSQLEILLKENEKSIKKKIDFHLQDQKELRKLQDTLWYTNESHLKLEEQIANKKSTWARDTV